MHFTNSIFIPLGDTVKYNANFVCNINSILLEDRITRTNKSLCLRYSSNKTLKENVGSVNFNSQFIQL